MILYQGLLRSTASWARVGRGYIGALLSRGVDVRALHVRGFRYQASFSGIPTELQEYSLDAARALSNVEVGLGFLQPPHAHRILGDRRVNLFVWEADRLPQSWVELLERDVDLVLVPSQFTRDAYVNSGGSVDRVAIVPYGFCQTAAAGFGGVFKRLHNDSETFTFAAVMAPHRRKGVGELLAAYRRAFSDREGVRLIIKTTYDPGHVRRRFPFEIASWAQEIARHGLEEPGAPAVAVEIAALSDEEVLAFFAAADVVVQPSHGEAFGLAILEAQAVGRPVLTSDWGGQCDFTPAGPDRLPTRLQPAGAELYVEAPEALAATVDVDALAQRMRWHFDHRAASAELGATARAAVAVWTWERAAQQLLDTLVTS